MMPIRASAVFLTYNQEAFVAEALQSLLDQDIDDLEIVVSDDGSTDDTWQRVQSVADRYSGAKRIVLNRNLQNLGVVGNYFKAVELSQGELIFTAAGDDVSLPARCSACLACWVQHDRTPDLIATDGFDMALDGELLGVKKTDDLQTWDVAQWMKSRPFIFGASHMMTKRLLVSAGALDTRLPFEDQCMLFRALLMGGGVRLAQPLVKHRRGGISQQAKNYNYQFKKQQLLKSANHALLECAQMRADALQLGCEGTVLEFLNEQKKAAEFACAILSAQAFSEKCRLFFLTPGVAWQKKFRYFQFVTLTGLHSVVMFLKRIFKKTK